VATGVRGLAIGDHCCVLEGEVASHVAQVAIHLQVASQGTGVVTVHCAGIAMYGLLTSSSTNVTGASC
jgi:hypothetical protein